MQRSECCGAAASGECVDMGLCPECYEHCTFEDDEEEEEKFEIGTAVDMIARGYSLTYNDDGTCYWEKNDSTTKYAPTEDEGSE